MPAGERKEGWVLERVSDDSVCYCNLIFSNNANPIVGTR